MESIARRNVVDIDSLNKLSSDIKYSSKIPFERRIERILEKEKPVEMFKLEESPRKLDLSYLLRIREIEKSLERQYNGLIPTQTDFSLFKLPKESFNDIQMRSLRKVRENLFNQYAENPSSYLDLVSSNYRNTTPPTKDYGRRDKRSVSENYQTSLLSAAKMSNYMKPSQLQTDIKEKRIYRQKRMQEFMHRPFESREIPYFKEQNETFGKKESLHSTEKAISSLKNAKQANKSIQNASDKLITEEDDLEVINKHEAESQEKINHLKRQVIEEEIAMRREKLIQQEQQRKIDSLERQVTNLKLQLEGLSTTPQSKPVIPPEDSIPIPDPVDLRKETFECIQEERKTNLDQAIQVCDIVKTEKKKSVEISSKNSSQTHIVSSKEQNNLQSKTKSDLIDVQCQPAEKVQANDEQSINKIDQKEQIQKNQSQPSYVQYKKYRSEQTQGGNQPIKIENDYQQAKNIQTNQVQQPQDQPDLINQKESLNLQKKKLRPWKIIAQEDKINGKNDSNLLLNQKIPKERSKSNNKELERARPIQIDQKQQKKIDKQDKNVVKSIGNNQTHIQESPSRKEDNTSSDNQATSQVRTFSQSEKKMSYNSASEMKLTKEQKFRSKLVDMLKVDSDEDILIKIQQLVTYKKQNDSFTSCLLTTLQSLAPSGHFKQEQPTLPEAWKFIKQIICQYSYLTAEKQRIQIAAKQLSDVISQGVSEAPNDHIKHPN